MDADPQKAQVQREAAQRQAALGRRVEAANDGTLGPVIKRWINAAIGPVASRIRLACQAYLGGDLAYFGSVLDSSLFGLLAAYPAGSPQGLEPLLRWCLKGSSPGRSSLEPGAPTYCDDLVLACLGAVINLLAQGELHGSKDRAKKYHGLTYAVNMGAEAARETALGQFLTQVQGADAMLKLRRWDRSSWAQKDKLNAVATMMLGQVKPQLEDPQVNLELVNARRVLKVMRLDKDGKPLERRISLRPPEPGDWQLLEVARQAKGEADHFRGIWISFAMMVLAAAQIEHGWLDLVKVAPRGKRTKGKANALVLSEQAYGHMKRDLLRWLELGFIKEPMIVEPEGGDYLTVKHRPVTGKNGPAGCRTEVNADTLPWAMAAGVMACTPWTVARETLRFLMMTEPGGELLQKACPDEMVQKLILGAYARDADKRAIYFPIYMDFRGRVYLQPTWITYQGTDLQKGLLRFPDRGLRARDYDEQAIALQLSKLYGYGGMDKEALPQRLRWFRDLRDSLEANEDASDAAVGRCLEFAEEPVQFATAVSLLRTGLWDCIPIQVDGTCNGLQHLSALFRDHTAAPFVNLAKSSFNNPPADLYGRVADQVLETIEQSLRRGSLVGGGSEPWQERIALAQINIDRKLCKKPVMVLPYGGTREAVEQAVTQAALDQAPDAEVWKGVHRMGGMGERVPSATEDSYRAFYDRDLKDHPLFQHDMRQLAQLVFSKIQATIPKAMEAMDAFRAIAKKVGPRALQWHTGFPSVENETQTQNQKALWVTHAYAKSDRRQVAFRGFHLPNSVRGLAMRVGRDEIDPAKHRTGIVANFIHSQDAIHLARTIHQFHKRWRGFTERPDFGAIHDCYLTRPSQAATLNEALRHAFVRQYEADPLAHPVRLYDPTARSAPETFPSWYKLADHFGVTFPERGSWQPQDVLSSPWFFS